MYSIMLEKNNDYTGGNDSPFANLENVEKVGTTKTEIGILTRIMDKYSRMSSFANKGMLKVKNETIEDTCLDMANYCILLAAYIKSKKK